MKPRAGANDDASSSRSLMDGLLEVVDNLQRCPVAARAPALAFSICARRQGAERLGKGRSLGRRLLASLDGKVCEQNPRSLRPEQKGEWRKLSNIEVVIV